MSIYKFFILFFLIILQSCNSSDDSSPKLAAPSSFSYPQTEFVLEKNTALGFQIPSITGEELSFSVDPALPSGLVLNTVTGYLSGIPTIVSSKKNYTITAKNSAGSVSVIISIIINEKPIPAFSYSNARFTFTRGQNIGSIAPTNNGISNFAQYSIGTTPLINGLIFNTTTGTFSGTPSEVISNRTFIVRGTTVNGETVSASVSFTINDVAPSNLTYTSPILDLTKSSPMSNNVPSSTGGMITQYTVNPPLPSGLSLNPITGVISGTPTLVRLQAFYTITATNSGGSTQTNVSITIRDQAPQNLTYGISSLILTRTVSMQEVRPTASGGVILSYTINPSLPQGMVFDSLTGAITGTPSVVSTQKAYTITAINSGGTTTTNLNIRVKDLPPQNLSYPIVSEIFTKNTAITNLSPTVAGGAVSSYSISPILPVGLNFNNLTGVISGTPQVISNAVSYRVTAANSEGISEYSFFLSIKDEAPQNLSYGASDFIFEKGTEIANLLPSNEAGQIRTYSVSPILPTGLLIEQTTGIIRGTPTIIAERSKYTISGQNASGATSRDLYITVNDKPPTNLSYGSSSFTFNRGENTPQIIPSNLGGAVVVYNISPDLPDGITLDRETGIISGRPNGFQSSQSYTITAINSGGETSTNINISINDYPPSNLFYSSTTLEISKNTQLGEGLLPIYSGGAIVSFSLDTSGTGGTQTSLPPGLLLNTSTGAIFGTPTVSEATAKNYRIIGTNTGGSTSAIVSIRILPSPPVLSLSQQTYSFQRNSVISNIVPVNTGDPVSTNGYSLLPFGQALPVGLSFNSATGTISGTPTVVTAEKEYSIRGQNDGGLNIVSFKISITEIPPAVFNYETNTYTIPVDTTPDGQTSTYVPINLTPTVNAGGGPITGWSITPSLPEGVSFNTTNGAITGIPLIGTDVIPYTITATNSGGTSTRIVNIKFQDQPPASVLYTSPTYLFESADNISIPPPATTGGTPTYFELMMGTMPAGLSFSTVNGGITKISNVAGQPATIYRVRACNFEGCSPYAEFELQLTDSPPNDLKFISGFGGKDSIIYYTLGDGSKTYTPVNGGGFIDNYSLKVVRSVAKGPNFATDNTDLVPTVIKGTYSFGGTCAENACYLTTDPNTKANFNGTSCPGGYEFDPLYIPTSPEQSCINSGLPTGISINSTTGTISGTISSGTIKRYSLTIKGVNDGGSTLGDVFIIVNTKPIAVTPSTANGTIMTTISLNGSASSDPDFDPQYQYPATPSEVILGDRITSYQWTIAEKPAGSGVIINSATSAISNFVPDKLGTYKFNLVVSDTISTSASSQITVNVVDVPPSNLTYGSSAYGFDNFLYQVGQAVNLNPTSNGGAVVSYSISPSLPSGLTFNTSTGRISGTPTVAQIPTNYTITATNTGGSTSSVVKIWINQKPTASISTVNKLQFGSILSLNGIGSSDPDAVYLTQAPWNAIPKTLTYSWSVKSKPAASNISSASFSNSSAANTTITPDRKGQYIFGLVVNDGFLDSNEVTANVSVGSAPSGISYPTQSPLSANTYAFKKNENVGTKLPSFTGDPAVWTISPSLPSGLVFNTTTGAITGTPTSYQMPTNYNITATNDGGDASVTLKIWINEIPIADAGPTINDAVVGQELSLVSSINDPDSTVTNSSPYNVYNKTYQWELVGAPALSTKNSTNIVNSGTASPKFTPDVAGVYVFRLSYFDGLSYNSNEALVQLITVSPPRPDLFPIANAGNDLRFETTGSLINLNGSSSTRFKGSPLSYLWEITTQPTSSVSTITNSTNSIANFIPDVDGIYIIKLTVSDGTDSSVDYITISAMPNSLDCTPISSDITGNTSLVIEESPYCLTTNININASVQLTIEPGVVIDGQSYVLRLNGGTIVANGLSDKVISLKNVKINVQSSGSGNINLNNVYMDGGAFCAVQTGFVTGACKGDISIQNSTFVNLVGNSQIGDTTADTIINNNIFANSHGIYASAHTPNFNINNNFVYNPVGGFPSAGNYFVKIIKDSSKKLRINNNYFRRSDTRLMIHSTNIAGQETNITKNYWNSINIPSQISSGYIQNPNFVLFEPFATMFDTSIPDGRKYIP